MSSAQNIYLQIKACGPLPQSWCKKLQHWRQEKWQKVMVSGSGSAEIRVKAGSSAKRVVLVGVNPGKVVGLTQPAVQQWRYAKVLRAKPQLAKRLHQIR